MNKNTLYTSVIVVIAGVLLITIMRLNEPTEEVSSSDNVMSEQEADVEAPLGSDLVEELTTSGLSRLEVTYEHTNPGEYSEIYVALTDQASPGEDVEVILYSPEGEENRRMVTADENGNVFETFRIYRFGSYHVRATPAVSKSQFNSSVIVK